MPHTCGNCIVEKAQSSTALCSDDAIPNKVAINGLTAVQYQRKTQNELPMQKACRQRIQKSTLEHIPERRQTGNTTKSNASYRQFAPSCVLFKGPKGFNTQRSGMFTAGENLDPSQVHMSLNIHRLTVETQE